MTLQLPPLAPVKLFDALRQLSIAEAVPLYVVGGYVRDLVLNRPCKDIDVLCLGDSLDVAQAFAQQLPHAEVKLFKRFGTAMVRWQSYEVEFVTARKESYQADSRKPHVTPGTLEDDILRRDFTINSLALPLHDKPETNLVDLCDGLKHLQQGLIKTPLDPVQTFSDDPLRMLRAVRFAMQLQFSLAPEVKRAIKTNHHRMAILSKERIIEEVNKILCTPTPDRGLLLLDELGLLSYILPEMEALKGKEVIDGKSHKDNFLHTLQVVRNVADALQGQAHPHPQHLFLVWAALLHDIAKPATKRFDPVIGFTFHGHEVLGAKMVPAIFRRLGLPMKQPMRYVRKLVRMHLRHIPLVENQVTDAAIRRFVHDAGEELADLLLLCRADITSGNQHKVRRYVARFDALQEAIQAVATKDHIRQLSPVIDGSCIMATFGLSPCKAVGQIKHVLKQAVLDGRVDNTYEALYPLMLKEAETLGLHPSTHE